MTAEAIAFKVPDADFDTVRNPRTGEFQITRWSHATEPEPDATTLAQWQTEFDVSTSRQDASFDAENGALLRALAQATHELVTDPSLTRQQFTDRIRAIYRGLV